MTMKCLANRMPISVIINGNELIREVTIYKIDDTRSRGHVGTAKYYWDSSYKLPLVYINNAKQSDLVSHQVTPFLLEWANQIRSQNRTNLCYEQHDARVSTAKKPSYLANYISGHPLWLTMQKESITCVVKATSNTYQRRVIIPAAIKAIAEFYVPDYCSACMYRSTCTELCIDPESRSVEKIFA